MVSQHFAFIEGLGGPEVVLILVITLLLFGGKKMPELARGLGKSIREFKKATANVEEELKRAIEEGDAKPTPPAPVEPYHIDNPPPATLPAAPATPGPSTAATPSNPAGTAAPAADAPPASPSSPPKKPVVPPHDEHPDLPD